MRSRITNILSSKMSYPFIQVLLSFLLCIITVGCNNTDQSLPSVNQSNPLAHFVHDGNKPLWPKMTKNLALINQENINFSQANIHWLMKRKHYFTKLTENASPYIFYIYQQTQLRHMPAEIALLPMVESAYNPFLYSAAGATGLWQLMPGTASGFGLAINWWFDGRRDIIESTRASLDYLTYLHDYFNNWLLAIAAYDCGEGTVQEAIRYNKKRHLSTDFWALPLPQETKAYIPRLIAFAYLIKNAPQLNIPLYPVPNHSTFTILTLHKQLQLNKIATMSNLTEKDIRFLNPGYRRWATPPVKSYHILLPTGHIQQFEKALANISNEPTIKWQHHVVKSGENLLGIAEKYHTHVKTIMKVNHLSNSFIKNNQELLIPLTNNVVIQHYGSSNHASIAEDNLPGPVKTIHTVQQHDTLESIAKDYHVKVSEILFWNKFTTHNIKPKQHIIIWRSHHHYTNRRTFNYRVKSGDSISVISHKFHIPAKDIISINNLKNTHIRSGKTIRIPESSHISYSHNTNQHNHSNKLRLSHYTVRPGDNLSTIAHRFNIPTKQLASWNKLTGKSLLRPGKTLVIFHS